MCWRTLYKDENVRWLFSLAPGSQTAMDEPLWPVAFAPPPCPLPNGVCAVGEGEKKIGALQAGVACLQSPTKKSPPSPRAARGEGARG